MAGATFDLGGLVGWTLSWTFCAELSVGRIILAKKPSLGAFAPELTLDVALSAGFVWTGRDARGGFLAVELDGGASDARGGRTAPEDGLSDGLVVDC